MNYNEKILKFIEIIDMILLECNQEKLLKNKNFLIPEDYLNLSDYLIIDLLKEDHVKLRFWFENTNLRIDIAEIEEAYVFNYSDIKNDKNKIKSIVKIIFTHIIQVESCGNIYTKIFFIVPNENKVTMTNTRHSILSFLGIKWNCSISENDPILSCLTIKK